MYPFPFGETVTVLRARRTTDPYSGEEQEDWTNPTERDYEQCAVDESTGAASHEPTDDDSRDPLAVGLLIFGPSDMDVTADDRMRVRGEVFRVNGRPARPVNPWTGWAPGTTVALGKVDG